LLAGEISVERYDASSIERRITVRLILKESWDIAFLQKHFCLRRIRRKLSVSEPSQSLPVSALCSLSRYYVVFTKKIFVFAELGGSSVCQSLPNPCLCLRYAAYLAIMVQPSVCLSVHRCRHWPISVCLLATKS